MAHISSAQKAKVGKVMHEFKNRKLKSHGEVVTDRNQAIAIALSEANLSNKKEHGGSIETMSDEQILELANTVSYYERMDNGEEEFTDIDDAKEYLMQHYKGEEEDKYVVLSILNYSINLGNPDIEEKEFDSLGDAKEYYNQQLSEKCTEHGKNCEIQLRIIGKDEPIESGYQQSELLPKDSIIVTYQHVTYMNYAYRILDIQMAREGERYEDLNASIDYTNSNWDAVYDNISELQEAYEKSYGIFAKLNSGNHKIETFLTEQGVKGYKEEDSDDTNESEPFEKGGYAYEKGGLSKTPSRIGLYIITVPNGRISLLSDDSEYDFTSFISNSLTKKWHGHGVFDVRLDKKLTQRQSSFLITVPRGKESLLSDDSEYYFTSYISGQLTKKWHGHGAFDVRKYEEFERGGFFSSFFNKSTKHEKITLDDLFSKPIGYYRDKQEHNIIGVNDKRKVLAVRNKYKKQYLSTVKSPKKMTLKEIREKINQLDDKGREKSWGELEYKNMLVEEKNKRKNKFEKGGDTSELAINKIINNIGSGKELILNETLHSGVGEKVYAYVDDLKEANIPYNSSTNGIFGYLKSNEDVKKFIDFIEVKDGYLAFDDEFSKGGDMYAKGGSSEYAITVEFKEENSKWVIDKIENILGISINDESMFSIEPERITIFALTSKEENILFDELEKSNKIEDIQSQEYEKGGSMYDNGGSITTNDTDIEKLYIESPSKFMGEKIKQYLPQYVEKMLKSDNIIKDYCGEDMNIDDLSEIVANKFGTSKDKVKQYIKNKLRSGRYFSSTYKNGGNIYAKGGQITPAMKTIQSEIEIIKKSLDNKHTSESIKKIMRATLTKLESDLEKEKKGAREADRKSKKNAKQAKAHAAKIASDLKEKTAKIREEEKKKVEEKSVKKERVKKHVKAKPVKKKVMKKAKVIKRVKINPRRRNISVVKRSDLNRISKRLPQSVVSHNKGKVIHLKRDAGRAALPCGKRVSKKGMINQFGKSKGKGVYYENRADHCDKSPKHKLEDGGNA